MDYALVTTVPPVSEPVSLERAKIHLRIDHDEENELIKGWIASAREMCEAYTGKRYGLQTVRMTRAGFPSGPIDLPVEPVSAVTKLTYLDDAGAEVEYANQAAVEAAFQVWLEHSPPLISPLPQEIWPTTESERLNTVAVEFTTGAGEVPEMVKSAMLLTIGLFDENRGDQNVLIAKGLPPGAKRLLDLLWSGSYR